VAPRAAGDAARRGGKQRGRKGQRRSSRRRERWGERGGGDEKTRETEAEAEYSTVLHGEYIFAFVDSVEKPENPTRNDEKAG